MSEILSRKQAILWQPGAVLMLSAGILLGKAGGTGWLLPALGAVSAFAACLLLKSWGRLAALFLAFLLLGTAAGYRAYHPIIPEPGAYQIEGFVAEAIRDGKEQQHRTVLRDLSLNGKPFSSGGYWSFYSDEVPSGLCPGAHVFFTARIYQPAEEENEGGFNFKEYLLQQNITIGIYGINDFQVIEGGFSLWGAAARLRYQLSDQLLSVMGEQAGPYASAMLLGTKDLLPSEDREAFNRLGIGHLMSVSGYHVGVLFLLLSWFFNLLRVPRWVDLPVLTIVLSAYSLLTGMHAPVVRASLLLVIAQLGRATRSATWGEMMLCLSALIQLLFSPQQLISASFQLTYCALIGLLLITPAIQRMVKTRKWWLKGPWNALCAAIGAQIGVLLPQLYWYQELPTMGIVLNVIVLAVSQIWLGVYWLIFALMYIPGIGGIVGRFGALVTGCITELAKSGANASWLNLWTPQASWLTAVGWLMLILFGSRLFSLRRRSRLLLTGAGMCLVAVSLLPFPHTTTEYIQLSVGNADAAVLWDKEMVSVIDTGEAGSGLSAWLHQRRLSVDALFLTHLHDDHAGGVQNLLNDGIPVKVCYLSTEADTAAVSEEMSGLLADLAASGTEIRHLSRGDEILLPSGKMDVVWPEKGKSRPGRDANESSLTLRAVIRHTSMLLTGDLDGAYEMYAAEPAQILKAAHHGSSASTGQAFLSQVSPALILQSCGDDEREFSLKERAAGVPVFCTNTAGQITIRFLQDGFQVSTYHPIKQEGMICQSSPGEK